ncbi:hypothetical protein DID75_04755, partial [Candidatus Marinamargulisbacteria bacterium SCGC AG-410-N11]
ELRIIFKIFKEAYENNLHESLSAVSQSFQDYLELAKKAKTFIVKVTGTITLEPTFKGVKGFVDIKLDNKQYRVFILPKYLNEILHHQGLSLTDIKLNPKSLNNKKVTAYIVPPQPTQISGYTKSPNLLGKNVKLVIEKVKEKTNSIN